MNIHPGALCAKPSAALALVVMATAAATALSVQPSARVQAFSFGPVVLNMNDCECMHVVSRADRARLQRAQPRLSRCSLVSYSAS